MKTYLQSHSSTMHVHKTDNDSWSIRNTNATVSQSINLNAYKSEKNSPLEGWIVLYVQIPFLWEQNLLHKLFSCKCIQKHHTNFKTKQIYWDTRKQGQKLTFATPLSLWPQIIPNGHELLYIHWGKIIWSSHDSCLKKRRKPPAETSLRWLAHFS